LISTNRTALNATLEQLIQENHWVQPGEVLEQYSERYRGPELGDWPELRLERSLLGCGLGQYWETKWRVILGRTGEATGGEVLGKTYWARC
jgi:hypothetical protein